MRSRRSRSLAAIASCSTSRFSARALGGIDDVHQRRDGGVERVEQRAVVAEPARDRDRLARHRDRLRAGRARLQRRRQPGQQPRAQRAVAGRQRLQRLLEHPDQHRIDDAEHEHAAVGQRRPRAQLGVADRARQRRGLAAVVLARPRLAAPDARLAQRQQHLRPQRRRVARRATASRARASVRDRLVVGEQLLRARPPRGSQCSTARASISGGPSSAWCASSASGAGASRSSAPATRPCSARRSSSGQLAVQHLAEQRVAEAAVRRRARRARPPGRPRRGAARRNAASRPAAAASSAGSISSPATAARSSSARVSAADTIEALADHVAHAVRHHARGDRLGALLVPEPHHLLEEQRVALAALEDARLDVRGHRPDALLHEPRRRRAIQARPATASSPRGRRARGARRWRRPCAPRRRGSSPSSSTRIGRSWRARKCSSDSDD